MRAENSIAIGDNGGPAFDIDTDDIKMSWIKLDIADFKRGIRDLDYETRGYYITILVEMYDSKGKLPNDLYLLGKRLGTTARVARRVLDVLLGQGKVYVSGDWLRNKRCDEEREKLIAEYCRRHSAAVKREENRRKTADAIQEVSAKFPESLPEVSLKHSRNSQKFDESFDQTIPISSIKTRNDRPELWSASDQNCAHNLEKKKKEEDKKERNNLGAPKGGAQVISTTLALDPNGSSPSEDPNQNDRLDPFRRPRKLAGPDNDLTGLYGIEFQDGRLRISGGVRDDLQSEFPGVDLDAVCIKAAPKVAASKRPSREFILATIRQYAQFAIEDMAKAKAVSGSFGKSPGKKDFLAGLTSEQRALVEAQRTAKQGAH